MTEYNNFRICFDFLKKYKILEEILKEYKDKLNMYEGNIRIDNIIAYDCGITEEAVQKWKAENRRIPQEHINNLCKVIIKSFSDENLIDFARNVWMIVDDERKMERWGKESDAIIGEKDHFDKTKFNSFFYDFLKIYKVKSDIEVNRRKTKKYSTLHFEKVTLLHSEGNSIVNESLEKLQSYEFSKKYLSDGTLNALNKKTFKLEHELKKVSDVFAKISTFEVLDGFTNKTVLSDNIMESLYNFVCDELDGDSIELLKIKGPLGSYKNKIMQWLFISLLIRKKDVIPFYINLAEYEKNGDSIASDRAVLDKFNEDFEIINSIILNESDKKPLLMIEGIRDFYYTKSNFLYSIKDKLFDSNHKLIICEDSDYTINSLQKYQIHPIATNNFKAYLRIRSMNLNRKKESIEFIENSINAFYQRNLGSISPEKIYESLVNLNFLTIDSYWLVFLLKTNGHIILNDRNSNIYNLYHSICIGFLGSHDLVVAASKLAYDFEFGNSFSDKCDLKSSTCLKLLNKHRSILDYLIATEYVRKLAKLNLKSENHIEAVKELSFFNMVMQKNITRFVVAQIYGVDDYEHQIMKIARNYYDDLSLFGKSELTFWMARLKNPKRKQESVKLLRKYNKKEMKAYSQGQFISDEERRDAAFLLRGINVSLIYENDREALEYYLDSLIFDKTANSVNRGFHLEYYGDKPYIPNKSLLDFEDDITKGEATITVICLSLDRRIRCNDANPVALLEIMTLCNLIQARIEFRVSESALDVSPYISKCIRYLEWIIQQRIVRGLLNVSMYFNWMHSELTNFLEQYKNSTKRITYRKSEIMNKFGQAANIKRTGWVDMNINNPENIIEHMYNCWLMAMLYLPNTYEMMEYDKNLILKMLLVHDLGETQTGDITRPQKEKNRQYYDQQERLVMQSLLLSGTYPDSAELNEYFDSWNAWDYKQGINYQVAKDIDNLQTIYQFCQYCLSEPQIATKDNIHYWLQGLNEFETDIVKNIAGDLIVDNIEFEKIVKVFLN